MIKLTAYALNAALRYISRALVCALQKVGVAAHLVATSSTMPVRKVSGDDKDCLRAAGLILRRKQEKEFHSYIPLLPYQPSDYEVLLRRWPSPPFLHHLAAFSGPTIAGQDPQSTLLQESANWSRALAAKAKLGSEVSGINALRAVFLSVHGGGRKLDPVTQEPLEMGIILCYVLPTTTRASSVVAHYPSSPDYPQFYDLATLLSGMTSSGSLNVHPYTREMLSSLDRWLHEQHALPRAIHLLFSPSLDTRLKMYALNPLYAPPTATPTATPTDDVDTPDNTVRREMPLLSSTPFQPPADDSTLHETTAFSVAKLRQTLSSIGSQPVDMIVKNPLFGSGLQFSKVNSLVKNKYFGKGSPDYDALGQRREKWTVEIPGDGLPDWVDLFPLHKCACEGDVEGVRRCIRLKVSADEKDTDSWTPLHYACWYGELEVVKVLVEEASASLGIRNSSDSTPLHLAAATGHRDVVGYLLQQRSIGPVKTAIDNEGKSPLAVCLECRMNDWSGTAKLLREAYKSASPDTLQQSPSLLSYPPPPDHTSSSSSIPFSNGLGPLDYRGSQASLASKPITTGKKGKKTVRRQRVDFMSGQHQLAHFFKGKDTPTTDVLQDLYKLIKLSPQYHSVLALWIVSESLELQLGDTDKPLQLISSWPSLLSRQAGKTSTSEAPSLFLRRNTFFSPAAEKTVSDPVALELLYADAQRHVLSGYYPCSEEDAIYLGGITMQISYGDHNPMVHRSGFLQGQLHQVLPGHMTSSKRKVEFERRVLSEHSQLSQDSLDSDNMQTVLHRMYLQKCWQWPFYGATFFPGNLATKSCKMPKEVRLGRKAHIPVSIAVNTLGFHLISKETNALLLSLPYDTVEWDVSAEKKQLLLFRKDGSLHIPVLTKMAALLYSLVSRMTEQYLTVPPAERH